MRTVSIETTESNAFQAIEQRLCHIPNAAAFASRNLMKDAQRHVMSEVYRAVPTQYAIGERKLRSLTSKKKHNQAVKLRPIRYAGGHEAARGDIQILGSNISLTEFDGSTKTNARKQKFVFVRKGWTSKNAGYTIRVRPSVKAKAHQFSSTSAQILGDGVRGAFYAKVKAGSHGATHEGIWERIGNSRDRSSYSENGAQRIGELMGTAFPKMAGNERVLSSVGEDYARYLDSRADHYINLILQNGVPARKGGRR